MPCNIKFMIAAALAASLVSTGTESAAASLKKKGDDRPRATATTLSQGGQSGQQAAKTPTMSDAEFFRICKKRGGGASLSETGNRTCRDAGDNPVIVPYPIPID